MDKLKGLITVVGMPALFVAYWAMALVQFWAFKTGIEVWPGWGLFGAIIAFFVLSMVPLGAIAITVVAFIGAHTGWGWAWWQALLLVAPFTILGLIVQVGGGIGAMLQGRQRRAY